MHHLYCTEQTCEVLWRRERQRRMLRSVDALEKISARPDPTGGQVASATPLGYRVLELLGSSGLDDHLGGWVNDGDIRTCTVHRVSFSPAICRNTKYSESSVPNERTGITEAAVPVGTQSIPRATLRVSYYVIVGARILLTSVPNERTEVYVYAPSFYTTSSLPHCPRMDAYASPQNIT